MSRANIDKTDMRTHEALIIAGKYRLESCLDEGAFGAVYRAAHIAYGVTLREVAVKVAKRPMSDGEARGVFGDALLMARLAEETHDPLVRQHFVSVYDAGRCPEDTPLAGHPYLVMELIRGGSLASCLRVGPFPLKRSMEYFEQLLKALAFMHNRPVVHRDLKPANVLLSRPDGARDVLKVTDFGLAIKVDQLLGWVESGGDLAYLAPESLAQNLCSPQSDVYMLGLIFYEMIAGSNPFAEVGRHLRGDGQAQQEELRRLHLAARRQERFALLDSHVEWRQRPGVAQVIRSALASDMNSRPFENAGALQNAWHQALRGQSPARQELPWEKVCRLTREAEQCYAVGDDNAGDALLDAALKINQDRTLVPDTQVVGRTYWLRVQRLLARLETEKAGLLALEVYHRRRSRSACLALASYYSHLKSSLAATYRQEADTFPEDAC